MEGQAEAYSQILSSEVFTPPCSAGHQPNNPTVFVSHIPPAPASSFSLPNSIFISQHSSSSLQLQSAEHGWCLTLQFWGYNMTLSNLHTSLSLLVSFLCCPYFCIILNYHYPSLSKAALLVFKDKAPTLEKKILWWFGSHGQRIVQIYNCVSTLIN